MHVLLAILALATAAVSEPTNATLRTMADVKQARKSSAHGVPFELEGTVALYMHTTNGPVTLVSEEGSIDYYTCPPKTPRDLKLGDLVRISGETRKLRRSSRNKPNARAFTLVCATNTVILKHGQPLRCTDLSIHELIHNKDLNRIVVRTTGKVIDACMDDIHAKWITVMLEDAGERFYVFLNRPAEEPFDFDRLIGARVAVEGLLYNNIAASYSIRRAVVRKALCINTMKAFTVLEPAPEQDVRDITEFDFVQSQLTTRVNSARYSATGHVIAVWNNDKILLRTANGLVVRGELALSGAPAYGEFIRLTGYPETDLFKPILVRAKWTREPDAAAGNLSWADPKHGTIQTTDFGTEQFNFRYYGRLVRIRGRFRVRSLGDILQVDCDGQLATVDASALPGAAAGLELDSDLEVTGVCVMDSEKITLNKVFPQINGYRIVPRTPDDIRVLRRPPWWTPAKLIVLVGVLVAVLVGVGIWNWLLRRLVDRRGKDLFDEQVAHYGADLRIEERTRLAVELHDSLSQTLTGVAMEVEAAQQFAGGAAPELAQHLGVAQRTLKSCRNELRNCLWDLRNQSLEETDMNTAIRRTLLPHVRGVDTAIRFNIPRERFSDNTIHAILRIIRELSVNAIKHGHATALQVAGGIEGDRLLFSVTNNGTPFDPDTAPGVTQGHFGLEGIRERLRTFDGTLEVSTTADGRVRVKVTMRIPHPDIEEEKT